MDMLQPYPINTIATSMKKTLDEALINYYGYEDIDGAAPKIDPNFKLDISRQGFPKVPLRFLRNMNVLSTMGSFFFYIPIAISFLIAITEMLTEKDRRLKEQMIAYGMKSTSYWLSWILFTLIMNIYLTLIICITCRFILQVELFQNTYFWLFCSFFFFSAVGMTSLGF